VFKRIDRGETTWQKLGFSGPQKPGTRLDKPLLDVATKLEPTDRYMDWSEAQDMAKLSDAQLKQVKDTALKVDDFLNKKAASLGLYHEDGKVEFVMDDRGQLLLADVFGTLDENRFTRNGKDVSKQVIRDYYKKTPWYAELEAAKKTTDIKSDWPKPPKLAGGFAQIVGNIYKSFAQEWTGENKWGAPTLAKALDDCDAFLAKMK
jgi:phosphoribosylaminoimidazole-succinocarboxamide synthase